jgi:hypothetical protein
VPSSFRCGAPRFLDVAPKGGPHGFALRHAEPARHFGERDVEFLVEANLPAYWRGPLRASSLPIPS